MALFKQSEPTEESPLCRFRLMDFQSLAYISEIMVGYAGLLVAIG